MADVPVQSYSETRNEATYDAADVEHVIDTGTFVNCPGCGSPVVIHCAIESGCWGHGDSCGRGPWGVRVEVTGDA